jgi:ribokinase
MKALVIGGSVVDVLVELGSQGLDLAETKTDVKNISFGIGGGATNVALTLAKLDARVHIHCCLGNDREGQQIRERLHSQNIDLSRIKQLSNTPTGRAVILLDKRGEVSVLAERGANKYLVPALNKEDRNLDLLYLSSLPLGAFKALEAQISLFNTRKFKLAINPGFSQIQSDNESFMKLIFKADLLILNSQEALALTSKLTSQSKPALKTSELGKKLVDLNFNTVIVTDGSNGAYITSQNYVHFQSAHATTVKSTIGAGDTFGATFAYYFVRGVSIESAAHYAAINAARVISKVDANGGALGREFLEKD